MGGKKLKRHGTEINSYAISLAGVDCKQVVEDPASGMIKGVELCPVEEKRKHVFVSSKTNFPKKNWTDVVMNPRDHMKKGAELGR
jgi:hypothetical protein